jgi:hypothetical protein
MSMFELNGGDNAFPAIRSNFACNPYLSVHGHHITHFYRLEAPHTFSALADKWMYLKPFQ